MSGSFYEDNTIYEEVAQEASLLADTQAAAVAAAASSAAAQAWLVDFKSRYLGTFASDPTTDDYGLPLQPGAGYFNSTSHVLRVFNGVSWQNLVAGTAADIINVPAGGIAATNVQAALNELDTEKCGLASPAFTGTPTAPTAAPGTNTTQVATTAYADAIAALKANLASPTFTGTPAAPTAAADTNTTQLASTAFVIGQAGANNPVIAGAAAPGTSKKYSREDHVHPTDTGRQAASSNLTALAALGNWKVVYTDGTGAPIALALGADKTIFASNGASAAPTLRTASSLGLVEASVTANFTVGYTATSYNVGSVTGASPTTTPNPANGNFQHLTLNGSSLTGTWTFDVPASVCSIVVEVVNGGTGAVGAALATSNYTKVTGDAWASTNGNKYLFYVIKTSTYKHLNIQALQ